MIRVLLADDHAAIRSGLRLMLSSAPDIEVVGEASDGAAAVTNARALQPDVTLMDIRMPGTDGITATREIVQAGIGDVLVLTAFDLDEDVVGALQAGAAGFLLKSVEAHALLDAVRRVAAGEGVLAPEVTRRVLSTLSSPAPATPVAPPSWWEELTARERDVVGCLSRGLSNAETARELVISEATAKTHVSRVLAKTGCTSRVQLAILARDVGHG